MTSISLHPAPRARGIAVEQMRALVLRLRNETIIFAACCVLIYGMSLRAAFASVGSAKPYIRIDYTAGEGLPLIIVALLIPLSMWRAEDPARRAYHWAMPLPRVRHALIKVMAGLVWMMAAVGAYLLLAKLTIASITSITHSTSVYQAPWWEWIVPFTASSVAYFIGSATTIGVRHPSRWLVGIIPGVVIAYQSANAFGLHWLRELILVIWEGKYGLATALGANIQDATGVPNITRWGVATAVWGTASTVALLLAARRYMEEN